MATGLTLKKASEILRNGSIESEDYKEAFKLVADMRSFYTIPIQRLNMLVRSRASYDTIVAQRLKCMKSILLKLKRFSTMRADKIQDIAGVRIILPTISQLDKFNQKMHDTEKTFFSLVKENNYILSPKESGYRGIHLVYKYTNEEYQDSKDKSVELQIRTRLQHLWSTAVESFDFITGITYKIGQNDAPHAEYMKLASCLFAFDEGQPMPPGYLYSFSELVERLEKETIKIDQYIKKINNDNIKTIIPNGDVYSLIILDLSSNTPSVKIWPFSENDSVKDALESYTQQEGIDKNITEDIFIVLANAGANLERAYPNYFLNIKEFQSELNRICTSYR